MTNKTIPDVKEIFKQAAEIARLVPENMQVAAFNRALDFLTDQQQPERKAPEPERKFVRAPGPLAREVAKPSTSATPIDSLLNLIDTTQHPAVASARKVLDRSLMVLQIALRNHDVDGLTPPEIARILTEKFRLNTSHAAVNMAFGPATTLVNRVPRGRAYEYRIMGPGEGYLSHLGSRQESPNRAEAQPHTKKRRGSKRPIGAAAASPSQVKAKARSGRPGPKQTLEDLISEKFFDVPRDISQMIEHIQHKLARTYKATDLSPALNRLLREKKLDRAKNDKGIYQYVANR